MVAGPGLAGALLALVLAGFSVFLKLDAARGYGPMLLVVIASYYELFAVMSGSPGALAAESLGLGAFALVAVIGFQTSAWLVVAALAAHAVFDAIHGRFIDNPGTPVWWPAFCMAFDLVAAASLGVSLGRPGPPAPPTDSTSRLPGRGGLLYYPGKKGGSNG